MLSFQCRFHLFFSIPNIKTKACNLVIDAVSWGWYQREFISEDRYQNISLPETVRQYIDYGQRYPIN